MPKFPKYKAPDGITVKQDFTVDDRLGTKTYLWVLFGEQHAIAFYDRGKDDPHLLMDYLVEDDENWFRTDHAGMGSTAWLNDWHRIIVEADIFCKCMFYPDMHHGRQYGYTRKKPK